jgi:hypothetical protein
MNDFERLDLSSLDPARDPDRWSRLVALTRLRVEETLDRAVPLPSALDLVGGWLRPVLAAAAAVILGLGSARLVVGGRDTALDRASQARRLAALTEESLSRGTRPAGSQLLVALRARSAP